MARRANEGRLRELAETIEARPGLTAAKLARELGWQRSAVTRALPALEERGVLLTEDGQGRLAPFEKET